VAESVQGSDWYPAFSMEIVKNRSGGVGRDNYNINGVDITD
jgi:hypothetical protein